MFNARTVRLSLLAASAAGLIGALAIAAQPQPPAPGQGDAPRQPRPRDGQPGGPREGQPGGPGAPGEGGNRRGQQGGGQSLENLMKGMGRAVKGARESVTDASKKDETLRLINDAQRSCVGAKGQLPREQLEKAKDDAERTKMREDYRRDMLNVLKKLISAEENVMAGKLDAAAADLDAVDTMRQEGHKEFGVKQH